jgi:hypothetical protein
VNTSRACLSCRGDLGRGFNHAWKQYGKKEARAGMDKHEILLICCTK